MVLEAGSYAFRAELDISYESALEMIRSALEEAGLQILAAMNLQEALQGRLGLEFPHYTILVTTNLLYAYYALKAEMEIGTLLPFHIAVYGNVESSTIAIVDPFSIFGLVENEELDPIAEQIESAFQQILEYLVEDYEEEEEIEDEDQV
jgi:uncharacterized protein (DUF302 family)